MRTRHAKTVLGALLIALALYAILAAPGALTDRASTAPEARRVAAGRP